MEKFSDDDEMVSHYLSGQWICSNYIDNMMERIIKSREIIGVFASIEKDKDEHNHVHLLLASKNAEQIR